MMNSKNLELLSSRRKMQNWKFRVFRLVQARQKASPSRPRGNATRKASVPAQELSPETLEVGRILEKGYPSFKAKSLRESSTIFPHSSRLKKIVPSSFGKDILTE